MIKFHVKKNQDCKSDNRVPCAMCASRRQVSTQPKLELFAESETVFFFKTVNAQVTFVVSAQGEVTGIVFRQGGSDIPAKKI